MVYAPHLRLTCSGVMKLSTGPVWETFSYRVNLSLANALDTPFTPARAADYAADCVLFHGDSRMGISAVSRLREVKLARIGADGKYLENPLIVATDTPGGSPAGLQHAPQVAWCMSLGTDRRGASGRGRFYIPTPTALVNSADGLVEATPTTNATAGLQAFLNNLNNQAGVDGSAPKVTVSSVKGFNSDVTSCRVGRVLDTIRSRRQALQELYAAPLPVS